MLLNVRRLFNFGKFVIPALVIFTVGYFIQKGPDDLKKQKENLVHENMPAEIPADTTLRNRIVAYSYELLGTPYVVAGSDKDGFDCSGFVHFVFKNFEINVPRSTAAFESFGEEVFIENVQKGDLLLFLSPTRNAVGHIGIVTDANGTDSEFIHASSGQEMKVIFTNLSNEGYTRRFIKAIRVL